MAKGFVTVIDDSFKPEDVEFPRRANWDPLIGPWGHHIVSKWHVVTRGLVPGIYPTWIDAAPQVQGVPESAFQSVPSRDTAVKIYMEAVANHQVEILARRRPRVSPAHTQHNVTSRLAVSPDPVSSQLYPRSLQGEPTRVLSASLSRINISNDAPGTPDSAWSRTNSPRPRRHGGHGSSDLLSPLNLAPAHALPIIHRSSSPDVRRPVPLGRSQSEGLVQSSGTEGVRSPDRPSRLEYTHQSTGSASPASFRSGSSGVFIGNRGHLKPFQSVTKQSPKSIVRSASAVDKKTLERGSPSPVSESKWSSPKVDKDHARIPSAHLQSPLPCDISKGTAWLSTSSSSRQSSRKAPPSPHRVIYPPNLDARSPSSQLPNLTSIPFGRPSPSAQPLTVATD